MGRKAGGGLGKGETAREKVYIVLNSSLILSVVESASFTPPSNYLLSSFVRCLRRREKRKQQTENVRFHWEGLNLDHTRQEDRES